MELEGRWTEAGGENSEAGGGREWSWIIRFGTLYG